MVAGCYTLSPRRKVTSLIPDVMVAARVERERGDRPGALPMAEQERRLFLLIPA
jgi:hypothetical protein